MSLGKIMAATIGGVASAAKAAASNKKSGSGTSSGGSSSSSASTSTSSQTGSAGGNKYGNYLNDSGGKTITTAERDRLQAGADQAAANWHKATSDADKAYWHDVAIKYNTGLGKSYDDSTGKWSGGYAVADPNPYEGQAMEDYRDTLQSSYDAQRDAIQAGVDSAVADLNAQKGDIARLTGRSNAAAEQAYMQTINPNGSLAESLAANGLLNTGLTESSQISAGTSYQNAINQNASTETESLAEIERAITKAKLEGDLTAAQALAGLYQQVAEKQYENIGNIAQWNQWQTQNKQAEAGLTGTYNGQLTMAGQAAQIERESAALALEVQKLTAQPLAQLQLEAQRLLNEGYTLENAYKALQNKYAQYQMGM